MSYSHLGLVDQIINGGTSSDDDLTIYEIGVLYRLAGRACQKTGDCWPSQRTLAKQLNVSIGSIRKAIRGLVGKGYLSTRRKPGRYGVEYTVYTVLPPIGGSFDSWKEVGRQATGVQRAEGDDVC